MTLTDPSLSAFALFINQKSLLICHIDFAIKIMIPDR